MSRRELQMAFDTVEQEFPDRRRLVAAEGYPVAEETLESMPTWCAEKCGCFYLIFDLRLVGDSQATALEFDNREDWEEEIARWERLS
jgi:hypothetical protein